MTNRCPNCADNEQVITMLAYSLKEAAAKGYEPDKLTQEFVDGWLQTAEKMTLSMLVQQQVKADRSPAALPNKRLFIAVATILGLAALWHVPGMILIWLFS